MWICVVPEGQQVYRTRPPTISKAQRGDRCITEKVVLRLALHTCHPAGVQEGILTAFYTHSARLVLLSWHIRGVLLITYTTLTPMVHKGAQPNRIRYKTRGSSTTFNENGLYIPKIL